jgi:hypothetical protein
VADANCLGHNDRKQELHAAINSSEPCDLLHSRSAYRAVDAGRFELVPAGVRPRMHSPRHKMRKRRV